MRLHKGLQLADSLKKQGSFEEAASAYREVLALARKTNDRKEEIFCLCELGILCWNLGQFDDASDLIRSAAGLAEKSGLKNSQILPAKALEIISLYKAGKKYRESNNLRRSAGSFQQALNLSRRAGIEEFELKCLRQLGFYYWEIYDMKGFYDVNKEALLIAQRLKHKKEEGRCLNNIGLYYWKTNNYSNALKYLEDCLTISIEISDINVQAECLSNIGIIYKELGDFDQALKHHLKGLEIDRNSNNKKNVALDLNNIGIAIKNKALISKEKRLLYVALDSFKKSLDLLDSGQDLKTEIQVLNNIGTIYALLNDYTEASSNYLMCLDKAKSVMDLESEEMIQNNLGAFYYQQNHLSNAIKFFMNAKRIGENRDFSCGLWETYLGLGQCYEKKNDFSKAVAYYKKAVNVVDRLRGNIHLDMFKTGFIRNKLEIYENLINLLYRLNRANPSQALKEEIFLYIEKAKARAFLESLGEAKVNIRAKLSPMMRKREEEISKEISSIIFDISRQPVLKSKKDDLERKLSEAEDSYLRLIAEMRSEVPEIANLVAPSPCTIRDIQDRILDSSSALLEYFLGGTHSYVFLITKKDIDFYELPNRDKIESSVAPLLKSLTVPTKGIFIGELAAERIADEILFPIRDCGRSDINNLIIIPDGILYYLPFESLKFRSDRDSSRKTYMIERAKISYAPSSSSLLFLAEKSGNRDAEKGILAFGHPVYDQRSRNFNNLNKTSSNILRELYVSQGFNFVSLPYSRREVLSIGKYFPRDKKDIFLRRDAKEEVIKNVDLNKYQVIHFACHGFLDEKSPLRSSLVLSLDEDREEDGFLQVREIYNLRMNADLVVLSACQTGKGRIERGEGILGLPRIFFYAGAKSVISALWPIGDKSTAFFMKRFYKHLSDGADKSRALQKAKMDMMNSKYSHPFYWAAFILHGDFGSCLRFD